MKYICIFLQALFMTLGSLFILRLHGKLNCTKVFAYILNRLYVKEMTLSTQSCMHVVDAFLERQSLNKNRGSALWSGADGPRVRAGRSAAWRRGYCSCPTAGRSAPWGRTVRACIGAAEDRRRRLDLAPGRDSVGEEKS
jgi:hypothetical protein